MYVSPESALNFQEVTTLPFDSSNWNSNGILEPSTHQQTTRELPAVVTRKGRVEDEKDFGLEVVDAAKIGMRLKGTNVKELFREGVRSPPLG